MKENTKTRELKIVHLPEYRCAHMGAIYDMMDLAAEYYDSGCRCVNKDDRPMKIMGLAVMKNGNVVELIANSVFTLNLVMFNDCEVLAPESEEALAAMERGICVSGMAVGIGNMDTRGCSISDAIQAYNGECEYAESMLSLNQTAQAISAYLLFDEQ